MRAALMFLAATAAVVRAQVGQCPPQNTPNKIVYLADQHICSLFWRCDEGKAVLGQCPPGKHFSPSTSTCEDPATAGCTAKLEPCTAGQPQEKCRYSCSCSNKKNFKKCPTKLEFPTEMGVFFWVDTSTCATGPKDISMASDQLGRLSTQSAVAKAQLCPGCLKPGTVCDNPHFGDCKKSVRCEGATEEVIECPAGQVYDAGLGICYVPGRAAVDCISNPAPPGGCPTTQPLSSCPYTCECNVTLGKCPAQLRYDAVINIVDSDTHPNCRADPSLIALDSRFYGSMEVKTSSAKFNRCPAGNQPSIRYMPDVQHCNVMYDCAGGNAQTITCSTGSQFDTRTNTCAPNIATCQQLHKPPAPLPPSCPSLATCTAGATRVRHPTSCTLFCECVQGAPYLGACPPGQHFSEQTLACELPGIANCQARCLKLPGVSNGRWNLPQCATGYTLEKTQCSIVCNGNHQFTGNADLSCTTNGWVGSLNINNIPSCDLSTVMATNMASSINQTLHAASQAQRNAALLFVLDESGSVEAHNFDIEKRFVEAVVTAFPLSQQRSAGVITFSGIGEATMDIGLQETSTCNFISQLHGISYSSGGTDLAGALFIAQNHIRYFSSNVVTLVFVITDGQSWSDPTSAAQQLRNQGHVIFTIGVAGYDEAQLKPISSEHHKTRAKLFYGLPDFEVFQAVASYLETTYHGSSRLTCP